MGVWTKSYPVTRIKRARNLEIVLKSTAKVSKSPFRGKIIGRSHLRYSNYGQFDLNYNLKTTSSSREAGQFKIRSNIKPNLIIRTDSNKQIT